MDRFEKFAKISLLSGFCLLNAIDIIQTLEFLRMGIEANLFVVYNPLQWAILKGAFTFGLPPILYLIDIYLDAKTDEEESLFWYLRKLVGVSYVVVLLADLFFLSVVLGNMSILGRLLP
jgi:hypothetical protein